MINIRCIPSHQSIYRSWLGYLFVFYSLLGLAHAESPDDSQKKDFNIPAQSARSGLLLFAEQAQLTIIFPTHSAYRQHLNTLKGRYTIEEALEILLAGTQLEALSGHNNSLIIRPELASPAPHQPTGTTLKEILIKGSYLGSLARALDIKYQAAHVVDAITAEEIGKFPAQNAAEAMQLIPGITADYNRGQALSIRIRGLDGGFQTTTFNGRSVATNENVENSAANGRQFRYDVLPTELISGIDIIKSPMADLDDGAIGGTVNIRTHRPLEINHRRLAGSLRASYSPLADRLDPHISGLLNWINKGKDLGALAALVNSTRHVRQDRIMHFDWNRLSNGTLEPRNVRPTLEFEDRKRQSFISALQWQPSNHTELSMDILRTSLGIDFDEYSYEPQNHVGELAGSDFAYSGNVLTSGSRTDSQIQVTRETSRLNHDALILGAQAKSNINSWQFVLDVNISKAESHTSDPIFRTRLRQENGVTNHWQFFHYQSDLPSLITNISILDPSSIPGRRLEWRTIKSKDNAQSIQIDVTRFFRNSFLPELEFGFKWTQRSRQYDRRDIRLSDSSIDEVYFHDPDAWVAFPVHNFLDPYQGQIQRSWLAPDQDYFKQLFHTEKPAAQTSPLTDQDLKNSYAVDDKVVSGYIKARFAHQFGGIPIHGNVGIRLSNTQQLSSGHAVLESQSIPVIFNENFFDALPSINVVIDLRDNLLWRLSAAKVISRPGIVDIAPRLTLNSGASDTNLDATGGNPSLKPFVALQYDTLLEWYFHDNDAVMGCVFHKDVTRFIANDFSHITVDNIDYQLRTKVDGGKATIQGVEFTYQHLYRSLPSPFNGMGLQANYTHTNTDALYIEPDHTYRGPIGGVPKHSYNLVLFYEGSKFDARLIYHWRSQIKPSIDPEARRASITEAAFDMLNFNITYHATDHISMVFEGLNLLQEESRRMVGNSDIFHDLAYAGPRFDYSLRVTF